MWPAIDSRVRPIRFPTESLRPRRASIGEWVGIALLWLGATGAQAAAEVARKNQLAFDPLRCAIFLPILVLGVIVFLVSHLKARERDSVPNIKPPARTISESWRPERAC